MKIQVTEKHIENGKRLNGCACPIALAVKEALEVPGGIHVSRSDVNIAATKDSFETYIPLPLEAVRFVDDFDNDSSVEPFEFELPINK